MNILQIQRHNKALVFLKWRLSRLSTTCESTLLYYLS